VTLALLLLAGCQRDLGDIDGIFYNGDGRKVHCGADLDTRAGNDTGSIDTALERAAHDGVVVELYAHKPGITVPIDRIDHVLARAQELGLSFYTYRDFAEGASAGPGLALSFDDSSTQQWTDIRPLLAQYGARLTFFVSRYPTMTDDQHAQIDQLGADGHDIAAHSVLHLRAPDYVDANGLAAYMHDEAQPSIDLLEAAGHHVTAYAYPFGARTSELDHALLEKVSVLRSVEFSYYGTVESPCPH
jgi:peptidoglycan/xylan/chitin deacetylase (PgdA/CDA1 family)